MHMKPEFRLIGTKRQCEEIICQPLAADDKVLCTFSVIHLIYGCVISINIRYSLFIKCVVKSVISYSVYKMWDQILLMLKILLLCCEY